MSRSRNALLSLLAVVMAALVLGACAKRDQIPGNITVAAYHVPAEKLNVIGNASAKEGKNFRWITPNFVLDPNNNPHRLVIDFEGELSADVAVAENMLEIVWLIKQDQQTGGPMQQVSFNRHNLTATGNKVKGRAVTPPLSFKEPGPGAIEVSLERRLGLKPTAMTLSVRAGMESGNWLETLLSVPALLVGLVFFALAWWARR